MKVKNKKTNTTVLNNCTIALTMCKRLKGLLATDILPKGHGLLITPCNSIHTFFMKYSIDVVFLDGCNKVVHIEEDLQPWRTSKVVVKAKSVLEMPAGTVKEMGIGINDVFAYEE